MIVTMRIDGIDYRVNLSYIKNNEEEIARTYDVDNKKILRDSEIGKKIIKCCEKSDFESMVNLDEIENLCGRIVMNKQSSPYDRRLVTAHDVESDIIEVNGSIFSSENFYKLFYLVPNGPPSKTPPNHGAPWSKSMERALIKDWNELPFSDNSNVNVIRLAVKHGRSYASIRCKLSELGLPVN